jgi:hypothetical protein
MPTNTNMNHNANGYGAKLSAAIFFCSTGYQNYKSVCLSDAYIIDNRNNNHPIPNLVHESITQMNQDFLNVYESRAIPALVKLCGSGAALFATVIFICLLKSLDQESV